MAIDVILYRSHTTTAGRSCNTPRAPGRFFFFFLKSCAHPPRSGGRRVEGTRASNHGEFSNNNKRKPACSPMAFSCF